MSIRPYWESVDGRHVIYQGDCLAVLRHIQGRAQAVATDPPYGTGAWKRQDGGAGSDCRAVLMREEWDRWDPSWLSLTDAPTIGMFVPQVNLLPFVRMFVWVKPDPRPRFSGQPAYGFEPFIVCRGSVAPAGGMDYICASSPRLNRDADGTGHPHQKPVSVMEWAVSLVSRAGDTVLDPFSGSGTTGVACVRTGRRSIQIELSEEYARVAVRRMERELENYQPPLLSEAQAIPAALAQPVLLEVP